MKGIFNGGDTLKKPKRYTEIKQKLLQKEAMRTLYYSDFARFHNLIISIMENEKITKRQMEK